MSAAAVVIGALKVTAGVCQSSTNHWNRRLFEVCKAWKYFINLR